MITTACGLLAATFWWRAMRSRGAGLAVVTLLSVLGGDAALGVHINPVAVAVAAGDEMVALTLGRDADHLTAGQAEQCKGCGQVLGQRTAVSSLHRCDADQRKACRQ